jgi:hypothetical protein
MACDVATAAEAKQLVLFHHEPNYDDSVVQSIEAEAQSRFANTIAAYEGLVITLAGDAASASPPEGDAPPATEEPPLPTG